MLVVSEVSARQDLGRENDLAGMLRKVLHGCVNHFEDSFLMVLNGDYFGEPARWHCPDYSSRDMNRRFEPVLQFVCIHTAESGELGISIADIALSANA